MSLRIKLLLAELPLIFAVLLVGTVAIYTLSSLTRQSEIIVKENYRSVLTAERLAGALDQIDEGLIFQMMEPYPRKDISPFQRQFESELKTEEEGISEPGEPEAIRKLKKLWQESQQKVHMFQALDENPARSHLYFQEIKPRFSQMEGEIAKILALNQDAMVAKSDQVKISSENLLFWMITAILSSLALSLFLTLYFTRKILEPLGVLNEGIEKIGAGNFEVRMHVPGKNEISRLAKKINQMVERLEEYRRSSLGELLQAQSAAQSAMDSLPDPILIFGVKGELLNMNLAAESLFPLNFDIQMADPLKEIDPEIKRALEQIRFHVFSGKGNYVAKGFEETLHLARSDGDCYFLPRANAIYSDQGAIVGVAILLQDVTRLRKFDEFKNDLVTTVAQEFKEPLTTLRTSLHLCLEEAAGPLNEKQSELLYAARFDCERLQERMDEILDLAHIQEGAIQLHLKLTEPSDLVDAVLQLYHEQAQEKSVELISHVPGDLGVLDVDPDRIHLVFSNLIDNAMRHTSPGGRIEIRAKPLEKSLAKEGRRWLLVEISDTGEGIPKEYQRNIFEKFFRIPGKTSGAGLGLFIAKEIVNAHGGEIGVSSEPNQGSTFWFSLPMEKAANS